MKPIIAFKPLCYVILMDTQNEAVLKLAVDTIRQDTEITKHEIENLLKAGWQMLFQNSVWCDGFVTVVIGLVQYGD